MAYDDRSGGRHIGGRPIGRPAAVRRGSTRKLGVYRGRSWQRLHRGTAGCTPPHTRAFPAVGCANSISAKSLAHDGLSVSDHRCALTWFERLLGCEPVVLSNVTEAVRELAEYRYLYIEEPP